VDPSNTSATTDALGGQNLLSIYSVYEKLKGKSTASTTGPSSASEARPSTPQTPGPKSGSASGSAKAGPGGKSKDDAEQLKSQGNAAMQRKDYPAAIDLYTRALDIVPLNPIYLSNRAAAYSGAGRHEEAMNDAEMAVAADPQYTKAWSRLGLAKFALGDARGSMEAYRKGIEAEGNGGSEAMKKGFETAKKRVEEEGGSVGEEEEEEEEAEAGARGAPGAGAGAGAGGMPDLAGLASMLGGGGGGGGGMPDLASMMNNPMLRNMAQSVMQNPDMMRNIMNNPAISQMAERFGGGAGRGGGGGGGGMPDIASLMQDPSIRDM